MKILFQFVLGGGGLYKNLVIEKSKNNSNINFTEVLKGKRDKFFKKREDMLFYQQPVVLKISPYLVKQLLILGQVYR